MLEEGHIISLPGYRQNLITGLRASSPLKVSVKVTLA